MIKTLIDGYNLIFECGLHGKNVNSHSLAQARERLLRTLSVALKDQASEIAVVFDARRQMLSGQQEQESYNGITVLYSVQFNDADEMIEHLIQKHSTPKSLTVVSSDHRLHKAAAKRKASACDSDYWWDKITEVERNPFRIADDEKPKPLLSESELEQFKSAVENEIMDDDDDWMTIQ